jgi:hypothetical protein
LQKKLLEKGGWDFSEILAITMKEEMFEKIWLWIFKGHLRYGGAD